MVQKDDWRLTCQEEYLKNCNVELKEYKSKIDSDHRHCAFCWAKFSDNDNDLHSGYYSETGHWICPACFNDFKDMFGWEIIDD